MMDEIWDLIGSHAYVKHTATGSESNILDKFKCYWQPPPVQVKCLHKLWKKRNLKRKVSKVRMRGAKVKTQDAKFKASINTS